MPLSSLLLELDPLFNIFEYLILLGILFLLEFLHSPVMNFNLVYIFIILIFRGLRIFNINILFRLWVITEKLTNFQIFLDNLGNIYNRFIHKFWKFVKFIFSLKNYFLRYKKNILFIFFFLRIWFINNNC